MAISYVSQAIKPNPYIAPIDNDIAFKSLIYKNQKFEQGVQAVDAKLSSLKRDDILHPEIKAYRDQKMQQVLEQANKMGNSDFSDRNVLQKFNSITGLVSDDEIITNGIRDTRTIQNVMSGIEKIKTDPKLNKLYAVQNEDFVLDQINKYTTSSGVKSRYRGPSSPIPYVDYNGELRKEMDNVRKNILATKGNQTPLTNTGYFKQDMELSEDNIKRIAQNRINADPRFARQMTIDAWYSGRGVAAQPELVRKAYLEDLHQEIQSVNKRMKMDDEEYASKMIQYKNNAQAQNELKTSYNDRKAAFQQKLASMQEYQQKVEMGEVSTDSILYNKFQNQYLTGLAAEYAFKSTRVMSDPTQLAAWRNQLEASRLDLSGKRLQLDEWVAKSRNAIDLQQLTQGWARIANETRGLDIRQQEADTKAKEITEKTGLTKDPKTGQFVSSDLTPIDLKVTSKDFTALDTDNKVLHTQFESGVKNFVVSLAHSNGHLELGDALQSKLFKTDPASMKATLNAGVKQQGIPASVAKIYSDFLTNYENVLTGKAVDPEFMKTLKDSNLRQQFEELRWQHALAKESDDKISKLNEQVLKSVGLTQAQLNDFKKLDAKVKAGQLKPLEPSVFGSIGLVNAQRFNPQAGNSTEYERWVAYNSKIESARDTVNQAIQESGIQRRALSISGDTLKENSALMNIIKQSLTQNKRIALDDARYSELNKANNTFEKANDIHINTASYDPHTGVLTVDATAEIGKEKVVYNGLKLAFRNPDGTEAIDIKQFIPSQLWGGFDKTETVYQDKLTKQGAIKVGGKEMTFNTTDGLPLSLKFRNVGGQTTAYFMYTKPGENTSIPIPIPASRIPADVLANPVAALKDGRWNQLALTFEQALKTKYNKDNITVHDFYNYITSIH